MSSARCAAARPGARRRSAAPTSAQRARVRPRVADRRAAPVASTRPNRSVWSIERGHRRDSASGAARPGRRRRTRAATVAAVARRGRARPRTTVATSPAAMRGSSRCLRVARSPCSSSAAVGDQRWPAGERARGAAELLEHDRGLDERGADAVVLLGDRRARPRRSARTASATAPRRSPASDSIAARDGRAVGALGRAATRTVEASSCCSSVQRELHQRLRPSDVEDPRRGGTPACPRRRRRARTLVIHRLRSYSAV